MTLKMLLAANILAAESHPDTEGNYNMTAFPGMGN
jgi:hypothetical protein